MANPELKKAMAEMKIVMEKYDIAGNITLIKEDDVEFYVNLTPSWSIITHDLESGEIRVKALLKDYPNKEAQKKAIDDSANIAFSIQQTSLNFHALSNSILGIFRNKFDVTHTIGEFEPHVESDGPKSIN